MSDPSGRFVLTYNGEIYNYVELRESLRGRWQFRTTGDTEVLFAGLALHGAPFIRRLEGMWAFAFWDAHEKCLLLSRDRMGEKPLFYQSWPDGFACASEIPALRSLSSGSWEEDLDSVADYFRYGFVLPGYTVYRSVRELPAGHNLSWTASRGASVEPYWQLPARRGALKHGSARDQIRHVFTQAVRRRLVADVEVGAFLSGGVDSSLVVGTASRLSQRPLKTFTIGFGEPAFDESAYAERVADRFQTDHNSEILRHWRESDLERLVTDHVGQPFADSSLLPTALVSSLAAKHVKVVLSGDGGDELFSGYQRYQARTFMRWYLRLPRALRENVDRVIRALPEPMAHHSRSLLKKAHLFIDLMGRADAESAYVAPLLFAPALYRRLFPNLARRGHQAPGLVEETSLADIERMMYADALVYLPQDILTKVDRASMAHSVETRTPFLDTELIELAFSQPLSSHRGVWAGKRLLKQSLRDVLPPEIWSRRKQGFGVPVHAWFRQDLGDRLMDMAQENREMIDLTALSGLLAEHRLGRRDHGYRLWAIFVFFACRRLLGGRENVHGRV